jgi:hypothetical protein
VSKSPDISLFLRLQKNWDKLAHDSGQPLNRFNLDEYSEDVSGIIQTWKNETVEMATKGLDLFREDYHEFLQLSAAYLDPEFPVPPFRQPGALHKARWMSKLLYSIKICMLEQQISDLPRGTIANVQQREKVKHFVNFCTLIYCPWWMKCSTAVEAPWNDIVLYQNLLKYQDVTPVVVKSAQKAMRRHLWYLTAEMIPLALFSENVPSEDRQLIADKLLMLKPVDDDFTIQGRFGEGFGKPKFPSEINLNTKLADLVTQDSWLLFRLLDLDADFLSEDVDEWPGTSSYENCVVNIQAINVVNDGAERAIKMGSDFLHCARKEENFQNLVQVVEMNRKTLPNLRKRKHNNV